MTRGEAGTWLGLTRARISHDLLKNQFAVTLVPGWDGTGHDRLDEQRDIVLRAVQGEHEAIEAVEHAVRVWQRALYPELSRFLDAIGLECGFVTTEEFRLQKAAVEAANSVVCRVLARGAGQAREAAEEFWRACDEVSWFLTDLGLHPDKYLLKWDPGSLTMRERPR